jgi:hydrogenase maturation protein HypF
LSITLRGAVQGVGFRPFVYRLATELDLTGWVSNSSFGVTIDAEGARHALDQFLLRLDAEKPPRSFIQSLESSWLDPVGHGEFAIRESDASGATTALMLPDIATCPDCLREVLDPTNRRFRYPFTNCTNCGPRFSIIEALPYDRASTSMKGFTMCPACQAEYDDPRDRRFHAQPNACPACGPQLAFWKGGARSVTGDAALLAAAEAIRGGQIAAVKGIGGFHLIVAAHDEAAVLRLRGRKHRECKPLAVMFPSLAAARDACEVSPLEERLLQSPEAPVVLLRKIPEARQPLAPPIAPGNPCLGAMLPYTPLHHLLLAELEFPVVCTSGNLSDEPICTDEEEARDRLGGIADVFLVHNRPIVRHVDDSIVRVMLGREMVLRRARGYAPLPVTLKSEIRNLKSEIVLAVGAHLKNSVALSVGSQVFVSQHIGDLETEQANGAFRRVIEDFQKIYAATPAVVAADLHPDYPSARFAREISVPGGPRHFGVQHHIAHILSCMAENQLAPPVLGVAWDGTGWGTDGTIWGGEFILVTEDKIERAAHLRPFRLPGGEQAVKEPRRAALGLLYEMMGDGVFEQKDLPSVAAFTTAELAVLRTMLARGVNSPQTTSIGRLFDAVASLAGLRQKLEFEGQGAMDLEFAIGDMDTEEHYAPLSVRGDDGMGRPPVILDWANMLEEILNDVRHGVNAQIISARFHNALARSVVEVSACLGGHRVALSGGCFQNRCLAETTVRLLESRGFRPYWHQRVPPNDGGIALGQVMAALRERKTN